MLISVHAVSPTDYNNWLKAESQPSTNILPATYNPTQAAPAPDAQSALTNPTAQQLQAGEYVFLNNTCINCHAIAGTAGNYANVGPNLTHVGGREIIAAGAVDTPHTTPADQVTARTNMAKWIHNPGDFKPGVHMPAYLQMSDTDLNNLAAYLESLK